MKNKYNDLPVFDKQIYAELKKNLSSSEGDEAAFEKYLELVHNTYERTYEACQEGDDKKFAAMCHNLKSSAASLGYMRLSAICEEIDICFKNDFNISLEQKNTFLLLCKKYKEHQK